MNSLLSAEQQSFTNLSAPALTILLEQGLDFIQRGSYAEGAALLSLARTQCTSDSAQQKQLLQALDFFLQGYEQYQQVQQKLQDASMRFAEVQQEQQARAKTFSSILSTLLENAQPTLSSGTLHTPLSLEQREEKNEAHHQLAVPSQSISHNEHTLSELFVTCFGRFEIRHFGELINLCPSRNGQAILRYLVTQTGHCASSDTLHYLFWPDDEPEVAQRKLHIAISALRRSLSNSSSPGNGAHGSYVLYKNHIYSLNPMLSIHTDIDDFLYYYRTGQQESRQRIVCYERACQLYTGPFLSEDIYADWSFLQRERLSHIYLAMCSVLADHYLQCRQYAEAAKWAAMILDENRCDEAAHLQLIQIYIAQGRRSEARQQYQRCAQILHEELGVKPLPETVHAFQKLFTGEAYPHHG